MANGYKQGRINEEVKRELALIIRDVKDPRIPPMTSVVHAQVSPDLKYAKVFVSILGDYDEKKFARDLKPAKVICAVNSVRDFLCATFPN